MVVKFGKRNDQQIKVKIKLLIGLYGLFCYVAYQVIFAFIVLPVSMFAVDCL